MSKFPQARYGEMNPMATAKRQINELSDPLLQERKKLMKEQKEMDEGAKKRIGL